MSETITLNFINQTEDIAAANMVICQHNAAAGMRCNPVAWRVLREVTAQAAQSFEVPSAFEVAVTQAGGQAAEPRAVLPGYAYEAVASDKGVILKDGDRDVENKENVSVPNLLEEGLIDATAYKAGRLIAMRTNVDPGTVAAFRFIDHVYVGLAGRVEEGDVISDAVASRITSRINLFGVRAADIVMTQSGQDLRGPVFHLENIQC